MRTVCTGLPSTRRSRRRSPASYSTSAELEPLAHHLGRDPVGIVADVDGVEGAQRGAVVLGPFGGAVGGVVGHLVVVAGDALARRRERVERGEALDVVVGELVHRRGHVRPPLSPLRRSRLDC